MCMTPAAKVLRYVLCADGYIASVGNLSAPKYSFECLKLNDTTGVRTVSGWI